MRCLTTLIALLTLAAYALGLPIRLHEAEHARPASACVTCTYNSAENFWHYRLSLLTQVPSQPALPPKKDCPTCIRLHATIAAPDTPIALLSAGNRVHPTLAIDSHPHDAAPLRDTPCRGPPLA